MSFLATVYQVLIASPSDVQEERKRIPEVLNKWNRIHSAYHEVVFLPIKWETHTVPEMGDRPQAIINKQIVENSDILIGIFWTKLGTHTGVAESGTVEEIQEFMNSNKKVMLYFSSAPVRLDSVDLEQYERLKSFKKDCQQKGIYHEYSSLEELEEKLFNHLTAFAQSHIPNKKEIAKIEHENKLLVQFYLSNHLNFSSKMEAFKRNDLVNSEFIENKKKDLKTLINQISEIKLPSSRELAEQTKEEKLGDKIKKIPKINLNSSEVGLMVSKELPNSKKSELISKTRDLLGIQLDESFFYVGGLKESRLTFSHPFFNIPKKVEGTEEEKLKDKKIQEFMYRLTELEAYLEMFNYIGSFFIAPLVLRNTGQVFNESITVKLKFPKNVEILNPNNIKIPSPIIIEEFTNNIFNYILRHNEDSQVQENFNYMPLTQLGVKLYEDYSEKVKRLNNEFKHYINSLFNVEIYSNNEGNHVLKYYFKELNPKENISFPSFILFKANETFKIVYEITSKNLPDVIIGELEYQIEH